MEGSCDAVLAFRISLPRDGPIVFHASRLVLLNVVFLVEFQVQPMLDGTAAVGVVENDFVVSVFMVGRSCLVPIPRRR